MEENRTGQGEAAKQAGGLDWSLAFARSHGESFCLLSVSHWIGASYPRAGWLSCCQRQPSGGWGCGKAPPQAGASGWESQVTRSQGRVFWLLNSFLKSKILLSRMKSIPKQPLMGGASMQRKEPNGIFFSVNSLT